MTAPAPLVYEPLNEYKPLAPGIGIVDGPLEYLTMAGVRLPLPFSTRMTVVQLKSGDLFLHSPATLAGRLQSMGRIRHLVSPNQFHYAHIGEWSRAFPDAVTWASPAQPSGRGISRPHVWARSGFRRHRGAMNRPALQAFRDAAAG